MKLGKVTPFYNPSTWKGAARKIMAGLWPAWYTL